MSGSRWFMAAWLVLAAAPAHAQRIEGTVVDSTGAPLAGLTVMLHNVTPGGGSLLGETTTAESGAFAFPADTTAPDGSVYFAAVRVAGQLYIGEMLRAPLTADARAYAIIVGPEGRLPPIGPAATTPVRAPQSDDSRRNVLIVFGSFLAAASVIALLLARGRGMPQRRRLLIEIAELDERHAATPEDEVLWRQRRGELLDELRHESR